MSRFQKNQNGTIAKGKVRKGLKVHRRELKERFARMTCFSRWLMIDKSIMQFGRARAKPNACVIAIKPIGA